MSQEGNDIARLQFVVNAKNAIRSLDDFKARILDVDEEFQKFKEHAAASIEIPAFDKMFDVAEINKMADSLSGSFKKIGNSLKSFFDAASAVGSDSSVSTSIEKVDKSMEKAVKAAKQRVSDLQSTLEKQKNSIVSASDDTKKAVNGIISSLDDLNQKKNFSLSTMSFAENNFSILKGFREQLESLSKMDDIPKDLSAAFDRFFNNKNGLKNLDETITKLHLGLGGQGYRYSDLFTQGGGDYAIFKPLEDAIRTFQEKLKVGSAQQKDAIKRTEEELRQAIEEQKAITAKAAAKATETTMDSEKQAASKKISINLKTIGFTGSVNPEEIDRLFKMVGKQIRDSEMKIGIDASKVVFDTTGTGMADLPNPIEAKAQIIVRRVKSIELENGITLPPVTLGKETEITLKAKKAYLQVQKVLLNKATDLSNIQTKEVAGIIAKAGRVTVTKIGDVTLDPNVALPQILSNQTAMIAVPHAMLFAQNVMLDNSTDISNVTTNRVAGIVARSAYLAVRPKRFEVDVTGINSFETKLPNSVKLFASAPLSVKPLGVPVLSKDAIDSLVGQSYVMKKALQVIAPLNIIPANVTFKNLVDSFKVESQKLVNAAGTVSDDIRKIFSSMTLSFNAPTVAMPTKTEVNKYFVELRKMFTGRNISIDAPHVNQVAKKELQAVVDAARGTLSTILGNKPLTIDIAVDKMALDKLQNYANSIANVVAQLQKMNISPNQSAPSSLTVFDKAMGSLDKVIQTDITNLMKIPDTFEKVRDEINRKAQSNGVKAPALDYSKEITDARTAVNEIGNLIQKSNQLKQSIQSSGAITPQQQKDIMDINDKLRWYLQTLSQVNSMAKLLTKGEYYVSITTDTADLEKINENVRQMSALFAAGKIDDGMRVAEIAVRKYTNALDLFQKSQEAVNNAIKENAKETKTSLTDVIDKTKDWGKTNSITNETEKLYNAISQLSRRTIEGAAADEKAAASKMRILQAVSQGTDAYFKYNAALSRSIDITKRSTTVDELKKMQASLKVTNNTVLDMARSIGLYMSARTLTSGLVEAVRTSNEFGMSLRRIQSLANEFSMSKLSSELMQLDSRFGNVLHNANALYWAYSAGIRGTERELARFTETMSLTARVIGADVMPTIDAATTIMNAYGLQAKNAAEVSDLLFYIVKEGKANAKQLTTAMGQVISTANSLGLSLNELGAATATLTRTMKTQNAMTYLNNILGKMINPTKEVADAAREMGIDFSYAAVRAKGWANVMKEIRQVTGGNAEKISRLFPDIRGMRAAMTLLSTQYGEFERQLEIVSGKGGMAAEASEKILDTPEATLDAIKNMFAQIKIEAGDSMMEILRFGGGFTKLFKTIESGDSTWRHLIGRFSAGAAVMGTVSIAQKALAASTYAYNSAMVNYNKMQIEENRLKMLAALDQKQADFENQQYILAQKREQLAKAETEANLANLQSQLSMQKQIAAARRQEIADIQLVSKVQNAGFASYINNLHKQMVQDEQSNATLKQLIDARKANLALNGKDSAGIGKSAIDATVEEFGRQMDISGAIERFMSAFTKKEFAGQAQNQLRELFQQRQQFLNDIATIINEADASRRSQLVNSLKRNSIEISGILSQEGVATLGLDKSQAQLDVYKQLNDLWAGGLKDEQTRIALLEIEYRLNKANVDATRALARQLGGNYDIDNVKQEELLQKRTEYNNAIRTSFELEQKLNENRAKFGIDMLSAEVDYANTMVNTQKQMLNALRHDVKNIEFEANATITNVTVKEGANSAKVAETMDMVRRMMNDATNRLNSTDFTRLGLDAAKPFTDLLNVWSSQFETQKQITDELSEKNELLKKQMMDMNTLLADKGIANDPKRLEYESKLFDLSQKQLAVQEELMKSRELQKTLMVNIGDAQTKINQMTENSADGAKQELTYIEQVRAERERLLADVNKPGVMNVWGLPDGDWLEKIQKFQEIDKKLRKEERGYGYYQKLYGTTEGSARFNADRLTAQVKEQTTALEAQSSVVRKLEQEAEKYKDSQAEAARYQKIQARLDAERVKLTGMQTELEERKTQQKKAQNEADKYALFNAKNNVMQTAVGFGNSLLMKGVFAAGGPIGSMAYMLNVKGMLEALMKGVTRVGLQASQVIGGKLSMSVTDLTKRMLEAKTATDLLAGAQKVGALATIGAVSATTLGIGALFAAVYAISKGTGAFDKLGESTASFFGYIDRSLDKIQAFDEAQDKLASATLAMMETVKSDRAMMRELKAVREGELKAAQDRYDMVRSSATATDEEKRSAENALSAAKSRLAATRGFELLASGAGNVFTAASLDNPQARAAYAEQYGRFVASQMNDTVAQIFYDSMTGDDVKRQLSGAGKRVQAQLSLLDSFAMQSEAFKGATSEKGREMLRGIGGATQWVTELAVRMKEAELALKKAEKERARIEREMNASGVSNSRRQELEKSLSIQENAVDAAQRAFDNAEKAFKEGHDKVTNGYKLYLRSMKEQVEFQYKAFSSALKEFSDAEKYKMQFGNLPSQQKDSTRKLNDELLKRSNVFISGLIADVVELGKNPLIDGSELWTIIDGMKSDQKFALVQKNIKIIDEQLKNKLKGLNDAYASLANSDDAKFIEEYDKTRIDYEKRKQAADDKISRLEMEHARYIESISNGSNRMTPEIMQEIKKRELAVAEARKQADELQAEMDKTLSEMQSRKNSNLSSQLSGINNEISKANETSSRLALLQENLKKALKDREKMILANNNLLVEAQQNVNKIIDGSNKLFEGMRETEIGMMAFKSREGENSQDVFAARMNDLLEQIGNQAKKYQDSIAAYNMAKEAGAENTAAKYMLDAVKASQEEYSLKRKGYDLEQKRISYINGKQREMYNIVSQLVGKFEKTTQSAIEVGSIEELQFMSRSFEGYNGIRFNESQQITSEYEQRVDEDLREMKERMNTIRDSGIKMQETLQALSDDYKTQDGMFGKFMDATDTFRESVTKFSNSIEKVNTLTVVNIK